MPPVATLAELGQRITRAREAMGLKPGEAAVRYGVKQGTWSGMENGKQGDQWLGLVRFCQTFNITPNELLGFERPPGEGEVVPTPTFEDDVINAIEVILTQYRVASAADAYEIGKAVIDMAKKKTAPGVDRPSAVRSYTFDWMQTFLDKIKVR